MSANFNDLHSLVIYIIFGYALLLPLILVSLRLFDIQSALQRLRLYLIGFLTPPTAFLLYHTLLVKRCESGLTPVWAGEAFHLLCVISERMLIVFTPLLFMLVALALFKAGTAFLMIKRLEKTALSVKPRVSLMVDDLVHNKSRALSIKTPRVIFSSREGFAAFTAGFIQPVLIINHRIITLLNQKEIEALISHELVHIKQRDTLKSWLLHMLRDITLLNPLSALLLRGYLIEKEVLVDQEAVVLADQKPRAYAATLLKVWRLILDQKQFRPALASSFTGSNSMERRVKALLNRNQEKNSFANLYTSIIGIALFSVTLIVLGFVC